jgi:hypothetical protein
VSDRANGVKPVTLEEFQEAFAKMKQLGDVRTLRSDPTGSDEIHPPV